MCGIVGLLNKKSTERAALGERVVPMLVCMGDRGPDSAGLAVFGPSTSGDARRLSLYSPDLDYPWSALHSNLPTELAGELSAQKNHAILTTTGASSAVQSWLDEHHPEIELLSVGRSMDLYKDTGHPRDIVERYEIDRMSGSHCVGHTRMATESAVTPVHSHPFTAGEDFCLVHNGSLSNPYDLRRMLEKRGIKFQTDNDTEAACRFLQWRTEEGDTIEEALEVAFRELDGFYTLLIGTADKIVLVRDAFACKPAVVAETDDYVAIGSEFRTLAHLPQIHDANLFEPAPEEIYSWSV
ncbi:MAG: amidophosphoribosyltransferase [Planctomycetes bacterium]|nr:amidophosphoribosyltransferase [Planctomycetota bacterium]